MTISRTPGVIRADEAYSAAEFRRRAGLGDYAWRQVRRQIRVVEVGKKRYVLGADWLAYLSRVADEQESG
jgi:hypothetical protein